jgi:GDP-L-fucose synthase
MLLFLLVLLFNSTLNAQDQDAIKPDSKIFVAGHNGLVGSAICRELKKQGFENLILRSSKELDLTNQQAVNQFFQETKPTHVIISAAKVGGIQANIDYPVDFLDTNLTIQCNVMKAAYKNGVKKLLVLGSSCIYPRACAQPMKEEYLLTGPLEPTNEYYAIAKIAGLKLAQAYKKQHGANFISAMPTNLYGPNDNFNLKNSHVLPALLRKFHEAKINCEPSITMWGTGSALREFLHADDLASAAIYLMQNYSGDVAVNIGTGQEVSIKEVVEMVKDVVGYQGEIFWDATKPNGMPRKLLDVSLAKSLGWEAKIELKDGLKSFYEWYVANEQTARK